ncbi:MAG: nucleotidyltransferase domain-containing protein [Bacteroidales bacterium]|jgi:predicted nucleotidyltransferase|nr:nucleotidyltransferase domain-containing protein [Bacteroidales bacterium]
MFGNYSKNKRDSTVDKSEVITKIKAYKALLEDYFKMDKVYLFGSYAKDTYNEDSDIDVAIVFDQIDGDYFAVNPLLWKLRRQIDDRIEPIIIEKKFDDANFLDEIIRTGIEIKTKA